jgi:hypothetical protein
VQEYVCDEFLISANESHPDRRLAPLPGLPFGSQAVVPLRHRSLRSEFEIIDGHELVANLQAALGRRQARHDPGDAEFGVGPHAKHGT